MDRGVYMPCSQYEALFVSAAHSDADIDATIVAASEALLARGAPLRMGRMMQLESVDTGPVPASEFVLPSAPLTRDQLVERLGWPQAPSPGTASEAD